MSKKRQLSSSEDEDQTESTEKIVTISQTKKKQITPGVIYLSRIPNKMNVTIIRSYFDQYAPTGRIYLQLSKNDDQHKRERGPKYTEGWVEFKSKRDAKLLTKQLNNQQVGGRRRTPWYDEIWNIKYLSKFRWTHLHERFQYENEVRKKRLRQEVLQAKREANLYIENVEKGRKLRKFEKKMEKSSEDFHIREWNYDQQDPHEAATRRKSKKKEQQSTGLSENLLKQIFPS
jgi:ESF2/ABP1 family protein